MCITALRMVDCLPDDKMCLTDMLLLNSNAVNNAIACTPRYSLCCEILGCRQPHMPSSQSERVRPYDAAQARAYQVHNNLAITMTMHADTLAGCTACMGWQCPPAPSRWSSPPPTTPHPSMSAARRSSWAWPYSTSGAPSQLLTLCTSRHVVRRIPIDAVDHAQVVCIHAARVQHAPIKLGMCCSMLGRPLPLGHHVIQVLSTNDPHHCTYAHTVHTTRFRTPLLHTGTWT